jgi:hypothetical protein
MKYFYDTEFHEDGKTIDLISIGVVCEDGREFYAVSNEADYGRILGNTWLMDNVMNSIGHDVWQMGSNEDDLADWFIDITDPMAMSRENIRDGLLEFVGDDEPEFWAWYADYDHVALCQLFGKMIDLPPHFPMFTRDIRQLWDTLQYPILPKQEEGHHNALDDARYNMTMYLHMVY